MEMIHCPDPSSARYAPSICPDSNDTDQVSRISGLIPEVEETVKWAEGAQLALGQGSSAPLVDNHSGASAAAV
jgi:hypothetical protein